MVLTTGYKGCRFRHRLEESGLVVGYSLITARVMARTGVSWLLLAALLACCGVATASDGAFSRFAYTGVDDEDVDTGAG
jgi:hypothetical protein